MTRGCAVPVPHRRRQPVVDSTEVTPDEVADMSDPAIEDGVRGLKDYCETH